MRLITLLVASSVFLSCSPQQSDPATEKWMRELAKPRQIPHAITLLSGQMIVRAGGHRFVEFSVDPTYMKDAHVVGQFRASGGTGNDIQAVICDRDEFENWINGHTAQVLYSTPKLTTGKIDCPIISHGNYVLGFSNTFSFASDKEVSAEVELRYVTLQ